MLAAIFHEYHPNVKAVICFLKLLKVKVNSNTVNDALQNHPDWPSLLCVSDALNKWNVPNAAGKMESSEIDSLPTPFIACTNYIEYQLAVVESVAETSVSIYTKDYKQTETKTREDFLQYWTGVYLIAEPNELSAEKGFEKNRRLNVIKQLVPFTLVLLLAGISFWGVIKTTDAQTQNNWLAPVLQYLIYAAGVVVTFLLLWYEIDKTNPLLQKVCTGIAKGNCNAILTGKQAKLFNWLSWSEVGFFYFTGSLLALATIPAPGSAMLLGWLNLLALPYTAFSIYYQWKVVKQWCVLCLAVQLLLLAGAVIFTGFYQVSDFSFLNASLAGFVLLAYTLPVLIWYVVKPFILQLQEAKNTKREHLRIKFNKDVFSTLLQNQKEIIPHDNIGIELGNPIASNFLVKVCSPSCEPCAAIHPYVDSLIDDVSDIKLKIIFVTDPDITFHPALKPARHLLAIASQGINDKTKKALDTWYLSKDKNYDAFAKEYPVNGELHQQDNDLRKMKKWCKEMGISYTPTFFYNGYQLPSLYDIKDLRYFLLE